MGKIKATYHLDDPETDIYVGDNRKILPQFKKESVDLIFADPPFNWDVGYDKWRDNMPREAYLDFTYEWLDACVRVLAPHGSIWINIPDDSAAEIVMHLKEAGLAMINWCIWHFRFGQCRNANFIVSKVHVLYFAKNPAKRIWNPDPILEPSDRAMTYADHRTRKTQNPGLRVPLDVWYGQYWGRIQGNNKERRPKHQNQIQEVYMQRVVEACSNIGDLVLDPFLGSGTTSTVARALRRRSIGIEYSKKIAKSAFERIEKKGPVRLEDPFERAVRRAFRSIHMGESSDEVIINDDLRDAFIGACDAELSKLGLAGKKEYEYNWTLENLRKASKLGRISDRRRKSRSAIGTSDYKRATEVAKQLVKNGLRRTIDRTMCDPELRNDFNQKAANIDPGVDLYLVRKAALRWRKKGRRRLSSEKV